jgi:hypothetical protein
MELSEVWTCGCGAQNTGDVFYGACWKCGVSWEKEPLQIEDASKYQMCPDCKATDGFHAMNCPTHPLPKEWLANGQGKKEG